MIHGSGGVDGSFGDATFNAVVYYQTQKGITSNGWVGPQTWGKIDDDMSYDSTVYFSSDGYFDMYKGTGLYYKNYVVRRGAVSGVWSVRTSHPTGASYATNGTYQVFAPGFEDYRLVAGSDAVELGDTTYFNNYIGISKTWFTTDFNGNAGMFFCKLIIALHCINNCGKIMYLWFTRVILHSLTQIFF